ncbi:hypothetical protein UlMin_015767 [Ulmus minor]
MATASYTTLSHPSPKLLVWQLFKKESSTYTYLLANVSHPEKPALLIDPVDKTVERDLNLVKELGLKLIYAMNTHVHADHVTGTGLIKVSTFYLINQSNSFLLPSVKSIISKAIQSKADLLIEAGDKIYIGDLFLEICEFHAKASTVTVTGTQQRFCQQCSRFRDMYTSISMKCYIFRVNAMYKQFTKNQK